VSESIFGVDQYPTSLPEQHDISPLTSQVKNGHKAEVVTSVKGTTIRCAEETPDMYASIDAVTDRLKRKLRQYKERRLDGYHGGPHMGANLAEALDEMTNQWEDSTPTPVATTKQEEFVDPEAPVITKIKRFVQILFVSNKFSHLIHFTHSIILLCSYDLSKGISVQEAIFALNYVDHDFYVFRDEASGEISVVYKRNAGGYGLIQPQGP
jgi:putative sigma-54 modulation protein